MRRREFITLLGGTAVIGPLQAPAQQPKRLPVVGFVASAAPMADIAGPDPVAAVARAFLHELRDLGWIDGRTATIERRTAEGDASRAPAIIAELLARNVDVIVLTSTRWLHLAAQNATRTIPTVAAFADDPVAAGLVASLSRPGGNLTGAMLTTGPEFNGKRLQLLTELAARITRIAFLGTQDVLDQFISVVHITGITVIPVPVNAAEHYEAAFDAIRQARVNALLVSTGPLNTIHAQRIVAFAMNARLPTMHANRRAVEEGGLMFYGASDLASFRQIAHFVDRILKGARPIDLPIERPTKFELVLNLKTAKALDLTFPPLIVAQADEVIE